MAGFPAGRLRRGGSVFTVVLLASLVTGLLASSAAASPSTSGSADPLQTLANKYAPIVVLRAQNEVCGSGEDFKPTSVDTVLGQDQVALRGPDGQEISAPTAQDLVGKGGDWYLDYPGNPLDPGCGYAEWYRKTSAGTQPTLYARLATDPRHPDKVVLQYWFFYTFNDWNDKHEGDWEMVQVVFPATTAQKALSATPESVAYAQHEGSQVSSWTSRSLVKVGDRPVVYPGQGSHAAYYGQDVWFGKSAAAGFGCDNTTPPGSEVDPTIVVLPEGGAPTSGPLAWVSYTGHWGQQEPSFNNGPTGPITKAQWKEPVTWQLKEGRSSAVSLPPVPGPALLAFCTITQQGSLLFVKALNEPWLVLGVALVLVGLVVVAARRTRWRHADSVRPDRMRHAGQIVVGAFGWARRNARHLASLALLFALVLGAADVVRGLLLAPRPSSDITDLTGTNGLWFDRLGAAAVTLLLLLLIGWMASAVIGVVRDTATGARTGARAALSRAWDDRPATLSMVLLVLVVVLMASSLFLLPVAGYLTARWAVAPAAAVVEGIGVTESLRRSAELSRHHRWRAFAIQVMLGTVGLIVPGLLGAVLLLATGWPFVVSWVVTLVLLALLVPVMVAGIALHYYDLVQRSHAEAHDEIPVTAPVS